MNKRGKVWGETCTLIASPGVEVHQIKVLPKSECSLHCHQFKWNGFLVISGKLTIEVHKNDYALVDKTVLLPGDFTTVKPGEYHRFISHDEHTVAIEVYYQEPLSEDIVRKNAGKRR